MRQLTHGSLFAGIGGFDLGFERAGMRTVWQVEIDEYCRRVLAKHWPSVKQYADVQDCCGWQHRAHCAYKHHLRGVDVVTAGFPCQDISVANTSDTGGTGLDGERSGLWSEAARIIRGLGPAIVVLENSPALAIRGLDRVLGDLAGLGFDAVWTTIRASQVGARHRRERMLVCAYSNRNGLQRGLPDGSLSNITISTLGELADWPPISEPLGCRTADGIPARVDRTHALGNAIVPQIAEWIGRRIVEIAQ